MEVIVVVSVIGLLVAIAVPALAHARRRAQRDLCIHNLNQIDIAKDQWAAHGSKPSTATPSEEELLPHFRSGSFPQCAGGGTYALGTVEELPMCTLEPEGHVLDHGAADEGDPGPLGKGKSKGKKKQK